MMSNQPSETSEQPQLDVSAKAKAAQSPEPADPAETRKWLKRRAPELVELFDAEKETEG
jgi:hypothetical protein